MGESKPPFFFLHKPILQHLGRRRSLCCSAVSFGTSGAGVVSGIQGGGIMGPPPPLPDTAMGEQQSGQNSYGATIGIGQYSDQYGSFGGMGGGDDDGRGAGFL